MEKGVPASESYFSSFEYKVLENRFPKSKTGSQHHGHNPDCLKSYHLWSWKTKVAKQWLKLLPSGEDLSEEQAKGRNAALNMLQQQVKAGSSFVSQENP